MWEGLASLVHSQLLGVSFPVTETQHLAFRIKGEVQSVSHFLGTQLMLSWLGGRGTTSRRESQSKSA